MTAQTQVPQTSTNRLEFAANASTTEQGEPVHTVGIYDRNGDLVYRLGVTKAELVTFLDQVWHSGV